MPHANRRGDRLETELDTLHPSTSERLLWFLLEFHTIDDNERNDINSIVPFAVAILAAIEGQIQISLMAISRVADGPWWRQVWI